MTLRVHPRLSISLALYPTAPPALRPTAGSQQVSLPVISPPPIHPLTEQLCPNKKPIAAPLLPRPVVAPARLRVKSKLRGRHKTMLLHDPCLPVQTPLRTPTLWLSQSRPVLPTSYSLRPPCICCFLVLEHSFPPSSVTHPSRLSLATTTGRGSFPGPQRLGQMPLYGLSLIPAPSHRVTTDCSSHQRRRWRARPMYSRSLVSCRAQSSTERV